MSSANVQERFMLLNEDDGGLVFLRRYACYIPKLVLLYLIDLFC
jgi:hypothetical protein